MSNKEIRENTIARFMESKARKKQRVEHLAEIMKKEYEQRTGLSADYVSVL